MRFSRLGAATATETLAQIKHDDQIRKVMRPMSPQRNDIWGGQYKIPWNDPDFSRRMLREHLSQEHESAS